MMVRFNILYKTVRSFQQVVTSPKICISLSHANSMLEQDQGLLVKMLEFQITSWDVQSSIELTKELNTKMCNSLSFDLLMDIMVELTLIRN